MPTVSRAARHPTYDSLVQLGWRWAVVFGSPIPHLVPPHGDLALCLRAVERPRRRYVTTGIDAGGCKRCKAKAGLL